MGIEYRHCYCVCDPRWHGDTEVVASRIDRVLRVWGLRREPVRWFDASQARLRPLPSPPTPGSWPDAVVVRYPAVFHCPACQLILGPPHEPQVSVADRYLYSVDLVIGHSRRVHPSNEYFSIEIDPAQVIDIGSQEVAAYWGTVRELTTADRPVSRAVALQSTPVPRGFDGTWKCALVLDCNKDLPAFIERSNEAPGKEFRSALAAAFGADLIEIGYIS